jgi:Flp pilus assembly protein TadG
MFSFVHRWFQFPTRPVAHPSVATRQQSERAKLTNVAVNRMVAGSNVEPVATLTAPITATNQTTITVASTAGLFRNQLLMIGTDIVTINFLAGNMLPVSREQQGTTAEMWAEGSIVGAPRDSTQSPNSKTPSVKESSPAYRSRARSRRGAMAVELAILAPLLFFLFVITVDFGRALYTSISLDNCCHNAAIYGSQTFDNQNQQWISGTPQYWQGPSTGALSTEQAALLVDGSNLNPPVNSSMITINNGLTDADGNPVAKVTIQYPFQMYASGLWGIAPSFTITRSCQMRIAPAAPY